jgi:hypothetical protein
LKVDQFEAEIESLQAGGKKKKGKGDDNARLDECQVPVHRNFMFSWHHDGIGFFVF